MKISARDESSEKEALAIIKDAKEGLGELIGILEDINDSVVNHPRISNSRIQVTDHVLTSLQQQLMHHAMSVVKRIRDLGIPKEHKMVEDYIHSINGVAKKMQDIADKLVEAASIPEAEGRELGSVEVKGPTTEEIHDEILDLYAKLKTAISPREKKAIQARIQQLHGML